MTNSTPLSPNPTTGSGDLGRVGRTEKFAISALVLLLNLEIFLSSKLGGLLATASVLVPLVGLAYWLWIVSPTVSNTRLRELATFARTATHSPHAFFLLSFVVLLVVAILRAASGGILNPVRAGYDSVRWLSVVAIMAAVVARLRSRSEPWRIMQAASAGLLAFAVLNAVLMLIGVSNPLLESHLVRRPETGVMLQLFGVDELRRIMPIANGTGGIQVAAGIPVGLAILRERLWKPRWALLLVSASALCVLLTDSRGGALGAALATIAVLFPMQRMRSLRWAVPVALVMPLLLIIVLGALSGASSLAEVSRGGGDSISALSGRPVIWGVILLSLSGFQLGHLIGFGLSGQVASGVNAQYAFMFAGTYADPATAGAHNTVLQLVLDVGYLGALTYLILCWRAIDVLGRSAQSNSARPGWARVGVTAVLAILFLGVTDATATPNAAVTLYLFLAVGFYVVAQECDDRTRRSISESSNASQRAPTLQTPEQLATDAHNP